ncbi:hypothetical protein [Pontibacter sp. G13]|uniref:hypothetical protein n=1 Tax=Pontibacter sp. G13 TaxID=3074898 RepID=UPI0028894C67|nr:hypothetical protein [Pontibacter sp. G13]WNJ19701.1 hypothetical protein RJD25_04395 [Pontibacter sp. G13]
MGKSILTGMLLLATLASFAQDGFVFHTPAYQGAKDLANSPDSVAQAFFSAWDQYVNRYTLTSSVYNLSGGYDHTAPGPYYVNPKDDPDFFDGAALVPVRWQAFPGRIMYYMQTAKSEQRFELADIGPQAYFDKYKDSLPFIPASPCDPNPNDLKLMDPYGPRGWLDEYCEMGIVRNDSGKITKLHFTCENPEYYWTLWKIDPELVLELYRKTLENDNIQLEDLYLTNPDGSVPIVRETGRPAYNPINKWNSGTVMTESYGGAMHLTSPPNELSAEIVLAGGAAVLREDFPDAKVANTMVCCGKYGRRFRHSDPHIGQNVYQAASLGMQVSLLNPVGLYLQEPQYQYFQLPDGAPTGAKIEDCFRFVRGVVDTTDYPNNMILHMIMEIPPSWNSDLTISDLSILGKEIEFGSQVMQAFEVQLAAGGKPYSVKQTPQACTSDNQVPGYDYFTNYNVLEASILTNLPTYSNVTCNILQVAQNTTVTNLALVVDNVDQADSDALEISFPNSPLKVLEARYAGPTTRIANLPALEGTYLYMLTVETPADAEVGRYDLLIKNSKTGAGIPIPQMIQVVAAGTLPADLNPITQ